MNKLFALALTASFALVLTNCQSNESNEKTQQTDASSTVIADTSVRASLFLDPHSGRVKHVNHLPIFLK